MDYGDGPAVKGLHRPSADLRVAADMESIGQEYHGKRVSRKALEATVAGTQQLCAAVHTTTKNGTWAFNVTVLRIPHASPPGGGLFCRFLVATAARTDCILYCRVNRDIFDGQSPTLCVERGAPLKGP